MFLACGIFVKRNLSLRLSVELGVHVHTNIELLI